MSEHESLGAWKFFVALGIVCLLVLGWYGFEAYRNQQIVADQTYNGFMFTPSSGGLWVVEIAVGNQPYLIPFYHHPRNLTDIVVHEDVDDLLLTSAKPDRIYIAIDPDAGSRPVVGGVEIARITGHKYNLINVPTQSALTRPADTPVDIPIRTCSDAGNGTVVIQFAHDPAANAIVRDGDCIILFYRTPDDSIRVADRFAYMLLRIM